jgi:hypothetical protein
VLNIVQTVGVIIAVSVSAYAVAASETNRSRAAERARVERVLDAVLQLMEAAIRAQEMQGQGAPLQVAQRRLAAELKVVGRPFPSTDILARQDPPQSILDQSEAAIIELAEALNELAPRPLLQQLLGRS